MKTTPQGWPRIATAIFYDDPAKAIDWLSTAFAFEVRIKVEGDDGSIMHSELVYGDGLVMVGGAGKASVHPDAKYRTSPRSIGGANTQCMMVYVDDVEAHCTRARASGAKIVEEPQTHDYGEDYWIDRSYEAEDLEGHHWYFAQRVRDPKAK